jgi:hypothetical protein
MFLRRKQTEGAVLKLNFETAPSILLLFYFCSTGFFKIPSNIAVTNDPINIAKA